MNFKSINYDSLFNLNYEYNIANAFSICLNFRLIKIFNYIISYQYLIINAIN